MMNNATNLNAVYPTQTNQVHTPVNEKTIAQCYTVAAIEAFRKYLSNSFTGTQVWQFL